MKNLVAKELKSAKFRQRIVRSKKGKGSYNRKEKHHDL
jgi:stalled ribosome alternative rescue factor ArfA